jgi:hypothetical protein
VLPTLYDDGGFSGGTMERPALKRLIADIEAGQIDVVVVYKVDRLTRALSDFAKLVEVFDRRGVSFVSITQQFNTATSMGRLTLNVLLSFAQFEREVTGECIRDKIAASKKKGMWMGGMPPLGYDVKNHKLVVNDDRLAQVRSRHTQPRTGSRAFGSAALPPSLRSPNMKPRANGTSACSLPSPFCRPANLAAPDELGRLAQDRRGRLNVVAMDVTDAESVKNAASQLKESS